MASMALKASGCSALSPGVQACARTRAAPQRKVRFPPTLSQFTASPSDRRFSISDLEVYVGNGLGGCDAFLVNNLVDYSAMCSQEIRVGR